MISDNFVLQVRDAEEESEAQQQEDVGMLMFEAITNIRSRKGEYCLFLTQYQ